MLNRAYYLYETGYLAHMFAVSMALNCDLIANLSFTIIFTLETKCKF